MSSHVLGISSVTARHGSGPAASGGAPLPLRRECSPCGLSAGERAARAATRLGGELHNGTTSAMPEMSGCYAQPDTAPECSRDLSLEQVRGATFLRYARPTSAPKYEVTRRRGYELCRQFAPRTDHYQPARSATSASARPISCAIIVHSQTWIYRLAFQREHPEHALHAPVAVAPCGRIAPAPPLQARTPIVRATAWWRGRESAVVADSPVACTPARR
jgi:hypothetical protein